MVSRPPIAPHLDEPIDRAAAVKVFAALSQASRLAVFLQIAGVGPDGASTQSLGDTLQITGSALTLHLRALEAAGLVHVQMRRCGIQSPIVVARIDRWTELCAWVADHWLRAGRASSGRPKAARRRADPLSAGG